jgi:hypothetical protein
MALFCLMQFPKNDCCFDRLSKALSIPDGIYIMSKEIEAEAVLENCRALINQITVGLSAEKPFGHLEQCRFRRVIGYQCR